MCKKRLFTRYLRYNCEGHASTVFTPRYLGEIQGQKELFGTWLHPTRLHSGEDQSFQLHIARKIGVNKTANFENILQWLVRATKSTSFFFTSTVINWPSTLITVKGDNCRSPLITVDRHLQLSIDTYNSRSPLITVDRQL